MRNVMLVFVCASLACRYVMLGSVTGLFCSEDGAVIVRDVLMLEIEK